jgi:tRNA U34 5-carboxymethylaminomethyl modifying enzyme MnmG/GidA
VTVTKSPDRIEVVMKRRAANGGSGKDSAEQGMIAGVDRVQHETQAEMVITRLTKYVGEEVSAG